MRFRFDLGNEESRLMCKVVIVVLLSVAVVAAVVSVVTPDTPAMVNDK